MLVMLALVGCVGSYCAMFFVGYVGTYSAKFIGTVCVHIRRTQTKYEKNIVILTKKIASNNETVGEFVTSQRLFVFTRRNPFPVL